MEERAASWADIAARTTVRRARSSIRLFGAAAVAVTVLPWLSSPSAALLRSEAAAGSGATWEQTPTNTTAPLWVAPQATDPVESPASLVASSSEPVAVHDGPDEASSVRLLDPADEVSGQLVFLVKDQVSDWLEVYLPVRPNGSTGWLRRGDVELSEHRYRIELSLSKRRLVVFQADEIVMDEPVGVGTESTPTPGGVYYLKELLRPPDPEAFYGPYAYGLSGFSETEFDYNGGVGVIGIHGTDDPASIGGDVSRGCIRLDNDDIIRLVEEIGLPLGTPVAIEA